jgi:hypothetical protein
MLDAMHMRMETAKQLIDTVEAAKDYHSISNHVLIPESSDRQR